MRSRRPPPPACRREGGTACRSAALLFAANGATAQAPFPTGEPLRVITPYGAGGGLNVVARILSTTGREMPGTRTDVVNMPGAGCLDAATFVRNAQPDGQALLMTDDGPVITIPLREGVPWPDATVSSGAVARRCGDRDARGRLLHTRGIGGCRASHQRW